MFSNRNTQHEEIYDSYEATHQQLTPKCKFGIKVARSIKHGLELDEKNESDSWRGTICKELQQLIDFDVFQHCDHITEVPWT